MFYDDARHFVLTTKEKFDLITSDPIHPFVKGSASLVVSQFEFSGDKGSDPSHEAGLQTTISILVSREGSDPLSPENSN